ncbi:MAG: hypothetical protein V2A34_03520 [Lentisphaerota bacterium]
MKIKFGMTHEILAGLLAFSLIGMFLGCEENSAPDTDGIDSYFDEHPFVSDPRVFGPSDVSISPTVAAVTFVGEEVSFMGNGGDGPYHWDVANTHAGSVIVRGWSQCIYKAKAIEANDVIVYDTHGHAAIAKISAGSSTNTPVTPTPTPTPTPLAVSPTGATLNDFGDSVLLSASGGTPPYAWSVANLGLGNVNSSSGSTVVYTRSFSGNNSVTVSDSAGSSRQVPISQP